LVIASTSVRSVTILRSCSVYPSPKVLQNTWIWSDRYVMHSDNFYSIFCFRHKIQEYSFRIHVECHNFRMNVGVSLHILTTLLWFCL
jgi:hypothetical protein